VRICSLLPSATEIVFALGMGDALAGITHECDFPPETAAIPKITRSHIPAQASSGEIDALVSSTLVSQGSLYELDLPLLEAIKPDLILTQRLCDVCAVSYDRVEDAVKNLPSHPAVLNLEPHSLEDIFRNVATVAEAAGREPAGRALVCSLRDRVEAIRARTRAAPRPRVFCMEWVDPPYCGGHWMKELVEIAGGRDDLAAPGRPSYRIEWERVRGFDPEVIVLTCCGFKLARCEQEGAVLASLEGATELSAFRWRRVFATDGSSYFSRPGPRIVDSVEILAHLIHPELFAPFAVPEAFSAIDLMAAGARRGACCAR
jgi:iron complex transport system substrate-binding protein